MKTLRPIYPNKGIEARYRRELRSLIDDMIQSYSFWIEAAYKKNPPLMAIDELPTKTIKRYFEELAKRWLKNFDDVIGGIVDKMVFKQIKTTDSTLQTMLKDSGFAVDLKLTPTMRDMANAVIAENVGLIKTIPQQFHSKVEGAVMRGYVAGHDLKAIKTDLKEIYAVTENRAAFIARDQVSKLNSATTRARQAELGFDKAIWVHSTAGKKPRPEHVAASGKEYDTSKGMFLEGKWTFPGYEINCRCTSRIVLPF